MLFNYKYGGHTQISSTSRSTSMSFAPDTLREPTYFVGKLQQKLAFREAISALHDVVISDLRFQPKDKTAYKEWSAEQEMAWMSEYATKLDLRENEERIKWLQRDLNLLQKRRHEMMKPFWEARMKYFDFIYKNDRNMWIVLDPIITIHPEELFFECFSKDESMYAKLEANYETFKEINEFQCGTTNIDYSHDLYQEFQKIRDYKETDFRIDPKGFSVQTTNEEIFHEKKIEVPESWVRGFLQVSSAMTLPAISFELHSMDIYNICSLLRRFKENIGPRSMVFILRPNQPISILFEPFNKEIVCARSIYQGNESQTIRVWGRRRLLVLERLIPLAKKFTVHLLGSGLPSFFIAEMGDMNFTLGLSGWTANDWSRVGNFDLMAPRANVDTFTAEKVFSVLKKSFLAKPEMIAKELNLDIKTVLGALSLYTQAGKVIFDIKKGVYRLRELSKEPLPMDALRFANDREKLARELLTQQRIAVKKVYVENGLRLEGEFTWSEKIWHPTAIIDSDEKLVEATCTCDFHIRNKLYKGPCEHILALRIAEKNTSALIST
mgnify:FL=1